MLAAVVTRAFFIGLYRYDVGTQITDPTLVGLIQSTDAYACNVSFVTVGTNPTVPSAQVPNPAFIPVVATLPEALAGTNTSDYMTPYLTAQAIVGARPILAFQVANAARPVLITLGGSWSAFLATAGGPDATDGSYEAVQAGTPAPFTGKLAQMLAAYLVSALGQSLSQASSVVAAIWQAAPTVTP